MALSVPKYNLHSSKRATKNPGILKIEGNKFYCNTITVPKNDDDTQNFHYVCAEKDGGCKANKKFKKFVRAVIALPFVKLAQQCNLMFQQCNLMF